MDKRGDFIVLGRWFYDDDHVVLPVVRHRLCVDYFMSYAAYGLTAITFGWAAVALVLGAGTSVYFLAVAIVALAILPLASYGEWAIAAREAGHVYTYLVLLLWLCLGLIWSGAACYAHVKEGKEYIEENWYVLQTQALPFTTQLDFKAQLENNSNALLGLCVTAGLLMLGGVAEAWAAMGGQLVMLHMTWATALPEAVTVILLASASASYAVYGATLAAWATPSPRGVQALLWHGAWSILVALLGFAQLLLPVVWGPSFLTHALLGAAALLPALILFVTSLVLQNTSASVAGWVQPNWSTLVQFVPERFQSLSWEKYAVSCYMPMEQAGLTGIMLSLILVASAVYHLQTAALLWSVGPELAVARQKLHAQHLRILYTEGGAYDAAAEVRKSGYAPPVAPGSTEGYGSLSGIDEEGSDEQSALHGARARAAGVRMPVMKRELSQGLRPLALMRATGSPSKNASGGLLKETAGRYNYGATSTNGDPAAASMSSTAVSFSSASADGDVHQDEPLRDKLLRAGAVSAASISLPGLGIVAAAEARARVTAMQQYQLLLLSYEKQVGAIGKRARGPTLRQWAHAVSTQFVEVLRPSRHFLAAAVVFAVATVIGLAVGLNKVTENSTCGILGYAPATLDYSTWFQLESGPFGGYAPVTVNHTFPFGSIQLLSEHIEAFPEPITRNMTVEITAYASAGKFLPTYQQLADMVQVSTDCVDRQSDDDIGGCLGVNIVVSPGKSWEDAKAQCLGLRVRVITVVPALYYTVKSRRALINISSNALDFVEGILNSNGGPLRVPPPAMQTLTVTTDSAAIMATNVYAARYNDLPPLLPASLVISSSSGDVVLANTVAQAIDARTGGNMISKTMLSASAACSALCGDVSLATTGSGRLIISQLMAAYSLSLSTEHGALVAVNTGMDVALDIRLTSVDGPITLSNFVQLHSNKTIVRTAGAVSASAIFANVLDIAVTGSSKVAVSVAFLGLPPPDPTDTTDIPFNPPFVVGQNYSYPALRVISERGDVTVLSVSGDPRSARNSATDSLFVTSNSGNIKVEVGGGGMNANFTLDAPKGKTQAEVDGESVGAVGALGDGSDPEARNVIVLFSALGNVQLAELPSPL